LNRTELIRQTKQAALVISQNNAGVFKGNLEKKQMASCLSLTPQAINNYLNQIGDDFIRTAGGKGRIIIPLQTAYAIIDYYFADVE
jgi:hypothetical protein